ncbi:unnamed protein product [Orchesella dallaii]|uniref:Uncharacterized protein n=1 Tax=Orchesella dallaii TaxID=48710 RepID=A0ABP1QRW5_9HEXA
MYRNIPKFLRNTSEYGTTNELRAQPTTIGNRGRARSSRGTAAPSQPKKEDRRRHFDRTSLSRPYFSPLFSPSDLHYQRRRKKEAENNLFLSVSSIYIFSVQTKIFKYKFHLI